MKHRLMLVCFAAALGSLGCEDDPGSTSSAEDGGDGDDDGPGGSCSAPVVHTGEGTYYDADGSGTCSFPATPDDLMVGAMNATDYADSATCGTCARVEGPNGTVDVRIVDQCPECQPGDVDLSPQAFERIAPLSAGRVDISWTYIPCDVTGPVVYHFKDGSNQWWTAVQVRNHRHQVERFEVQLDDNWVEVPRVDYNYFVYDAGMGPGPYRFRVTDVWGHTVEDDGIPLLDDGDAPGDEQLAACSG